MTEEKNKNDGFVIDEQQLQLDIKNELVENENTEQLSFDLTTEESTEELKTMLVRPDFPMSVAFIGAPNTGKSEISKGFIKLIQPWLDKQGKSVVFIENAGNEITSKYDIAMGQFGGYRENLWAFFNRLEREREAEIAGLSYVSSGTILEAIAHAGVNYETTMLGHDSDIITPDTQMKLQKIQVAMTALTYLFIDNFRYKFAFYVPCAQAIIIPGQDETPEQRHSRRVDAALQEIFRNFQLRIQVLDQPTNEERAQTAFDTIKTIYDEGIEVTQKLSSP